MGDWKLVHGGKTPGEGRDELYNLTNDPNESVNLAAREPQKLAQIKRRLIEQFERD